MASNPYQAPPDDPPVPGEQARPSAGPESARSVFLAWEFLRVIYNGILVLVVLVREASSLNDWELWEYLVQGLIGANLCFCVGPVVEGYVALLGAPRRIVRWFIFVPGMLLACLISLAALYVWHMRGFN